MPDISLNDLFSRMSLDSGEYLFFEERLDMIMLYSNGADFVSNTHLQCLLQMSKIRFIDLKKRDCRQGNMGTTSILDRKVTLYVQPTQSVCFYLSKW